MIDPLIVLLAIVFIVLVNAIKRIPANQRLVIFKGGRAVSVVAPGYALVLPLIQRCKRIDVRTRSASLLQITRQTKSDSYTVEGTCEYCISEPLKAASIDSVDDIPWRVETAIKETLSEIVANASIRECLLESNLLEAKARELLKRKTQSSGIKILSLHFTGFPVHKKLVIEIARNLAKTPVDLTRMIEASAAKESGDQATATAISTASESQAVIRLPESSEEYQYEVAPTQGTP